MEAEEEKTIMQTEKAHDLLRQFEPVIRYTRGEKFFPIDVETYLMECSLWVRQKTGIPEQIMAEGEITTQTLAQVPNKGFDNVYYLQFIEPLNLAELASLRLKSVLKKRDPRQLFRAGRGRLGPVFRPGQRQGHPGG